MKTTFEHRVWQKQRNLFNSAMKKKAKSQKDVKKTDFCIDGKIMEGVLILEKNSTSLDDDFINVSVYELDNFDSAIPFEGTDINLIKEEFPNFKVELGNRLSKIYIMYKDELPIGFGVS